MNTYRSLAENKRTRLGQSDQPHSVTSWDVVYFVGNEKREAMVGATDPEEIKSALAKAHRGIEVHIEDAKKNPLFITQPGRVLHDRPYEP